MCICYVLILFVWSISSKGNVCINIVNLYILVIAVRIAGFTFKNIVGVSRLKQTLDVDCIAVSWWWLVGDDTLGFFGSKSPFHFPYIYRYTDANMLLNDKSSQTRSTFWCFYAIVSYLWYTFSFRVIVHEITLAKYVKCSYLVATSPTTWKKLIFGVACVHVHGTNKKNNLKVCSKLEFG